MITASDVIENMENAKKVDSEVDIVIFAHVSSIEVSELNKVKQGMHSTGWNTTRRFCD